MIRKIHIYSHNSDPDGDFSGFLLRWAIEENILYYQRENNNITYKPFNYGFDIGWSNIHKNDVVFFADVSGTPEEMMLLYDKLDGKLIWIDHHDSISTVHEKLHKKCEGIRDFSQAACQNVYDYISINGVFTDKQDRIFKNLKPLIDIIGAYDNWNKSVVDNDEQKWHSDYVSLTFALNSMITTPGTKSGDKLWEEILSYAEDDDVMDLIYEFQSDGRIILDYVDIRNHSLVRSYGFKANLEGLGVFVLNQGIGGSSIFNSLDGTKYDAFVTYIYSGKKDIYSVSVYRSNDNIDLVDKLSHIGFKGHSGAGGFRCSHFEVSGGYGDKTIQVD